MLCISVNKYFRCILEQSKLVKKQKKIETYVKEKNQ